MTWTKQGKYAWTQGAYTISAARVGGLLKYTLWRGSGPAEMVAIRDSAEELKKMVTEREVEGVNS